MNSYFNQPIFIPVLTLEPLPTMTASKQLDEATGLELINPLLK